MARLLVPRLTETARNQLTENVVTLIRDCIIETTPGDAYSLDEVKAAVTQAETTGRRGKVVLTLGRQRGSQGGTPRIRTIDGRGINTSEGRVEESQILDPPDLHRTSPPPRRARYVDPRHASTIGDRVAPPVGPARATRQETYSDD